MEERTLVREKIIKEFATHNRLCLELPTVVGRTSIARALMEKTPLETINKLSGKKILILVGELAHIQNWKEEFYKWGYESYLKYCRIITYASLHKEEGDYSIIIADEVHHLCTEKRLECIINVHSPVFIGLSATVGRDRFELLREVYPDIKLVSMTLKKAIDTKALPEPKINVIPLELDNTILSEEIVKSRGVAVKRVKINCDYSDMWGYLKDKRKYPNLELHVKCTERQKYIEINRDWEFWKNRYMSAKQEFMKNKWLLLGTQRKRYLGELKTRTVYNFIKDKLAGKRYICFCTSIIQQVALADKNNFINSELKYTQDVINRFNDKKINSLYCVGMAQEGLNLKDVPVGIIIQLDAELRRFIQKIGRSLRAEKPEIYLFYYKNTRDEEFLNKVIELLPDKIRFMI